MSRFIPCHLRTVRSTCFIDQTNRIIDNHVLSGVNQLNQRRLSGHVGVARHLSGQALKRHGPFVQSCHTFGMAIRIFDLKLGEKPYQSV